MTPTQIRLVKGSFEAVAPQRNRLAAIFLAQLSVREPSLHDIFRGDLRTQAAELHAGLAEIVASLDRLYPIVPALEWLGLRAAARGIGEGQYAAIEQALLAALASELGSTFSLEQRAAWSAAFRRVSQIMVAALEPEPLAA